MKRIQSANRAAKITSGRGYGAPKSGWKRLADSVIVQTASDYRLAKSRDDYKTMDQIEAFLRSGYGANLCGNSGIALYILRRLQSEPALDTAYERRSLAQSHAVEKRLMQALGALAPVPFYADLKKILPDKDGKIRSQIMQRLIRKGCLSAQYERAKKAWLVTEIHIEMEDYL